MKILRGHAAVIEEFLSTDATGLKGQGRRREAMTLEPEELPAIGNLHKKLRKTAFCADGVYPAVSALPKRPVCHERAFFAVKNWCGMGTRKE